MALTNWMKKSTNTNTVFVTVKEEDVSDQVDGSNYPYEGW